MENWIFLCCRSTRRYGEKQQRFEHLAFLNFAQNVVCFLSSLLSMLLNYPSSLLLWFPFASLLMLAIDAESMHREWVQRKPRNYWHVMELGLVMTIKCFWDLCACCVFGTIDWLGGQTSSSVAHMAKLEEGNTSSNCSFLECEHLTCNWDRVGNYSSQIHQLSCTGKPGKIMYCDQLMVIDGFCERFVTLTLICWWLFHVQIWETFTDQTFCLQQGRKFGL